MRATPSHRTPPPPHKNELPAVAADKTHPQTRNPKPNPTPQHVELPPSATIKYLVGILPVCAPRGSPSRNAPPQGRCVRRTRRAQACPTKKKRREQKQKSKTTRVFNFDRTKTKRFELPKKKSARCKFLIFRALFFFTGGISPRGTGRVMTRPRPVLS